MPANPIADLETWNSSASARAQTLPPGVSAGAVVFVRGARWRVETLLGHPDCCEIHLSGGAPPARRVLLWPFDRPVAADATPGFRSVRLAAWASQVTAAARYDVDPSTPRVRATAVRILPYQLAPAIVMAGGAPRLLLADEVGLGKTIQAGWIVSDLLGREPGARVLIAVPAGLRRQWLAEFAACFHVHAVLVDARWLRATVSDRPADVSPWACPGVYVTSLDFLKRGDIAAALSAQTWDLLVVDEAHTAAAPNDRHAALSAIAARARRVVTISATPYSGDLAGFASMARLGGTESESPARMFRRGREEVGDARRRRHHFASVRISKPERRLQRALERYSRLVWHEARGDRDAARLAVTILRKRALSSAAAAARSLRRRLALLLATPVIAAPRQLSLFDEDDEVSDELPDSALSAPGLSDRAAEERWLSSLIASADAAAAVDSKERYLVRVLRRLAQEPVIVFTEYRDTLLQLAAALPPSMQLHGGLSGAERAAVQARFNDAGGLLLATDAAAEGLNLQQRCRVVVNYELPWNPARLEQRIGRIDRIGQIRAVHAITLVARDTAEDLVIANLARRLTRVVATLGARDRLGAFLSDARAARMVIGGDSLEAEALTAPSEMPALVSREPAESAAAVAAASRLRELLSGAGTPEPSSRSVAVAVVRAGRQLANGAVVVLRCIAATTAGQAIATRMVVLHAACALRRPRSRREARAVALEVAAPLIGASPSLPVVSGWFAAAALEHAAMVDRLIARETALRGSDAAAALIQPGLFDRRAADGSRGVSDAASAVRVEHDNRIDSLGESRTLHFTVSPVAVLIAWL